MLTNEGMKRFYGWRGSGKTYNIVNCAINSARFNKKVIIVAPFACSLIEDRLKDCEYSNNITVIPANRWFSTHEFNGLDYDEIYFDELDICINLMFNKKVKGISLTVGEKNI